MFPPAGFCEDLGSKQGTRDPLCQVILRAMEPAERGAGTADSLRGPPGLSPLRGLPGPPCAHAMPRPQVYPACEGPKVLAPYARLPPHRHVARPAAVLAGARRLYAFFPRPRGHLHGLVRRRRRLPEPQAAALFGQMAAAVAHCHRHGLVLRDLRLRRFVFTDRER